jgi:hypothetical protein
LSCFLNCEANARQLNQTRRFSPDSNNPSMPSPDADRVRRFKTVVLLIAMGCAPTPIVYRTNLDALFDDRLHGFTVPQVARIKVGSEARVYQGVDKNAVLDAALVVLMQSGVIAHASRAEGIAVRLDVFPPIIGPPGATTVLQWQHIGSPMVVLVDSEPSGVRLYANWLEELYGRTDQPNIAAIGLKPRNKEVMADRFFDRVAVQLFQAANATKLSIDPGRDLRRQ